MSKLNKSERETLADAADRDGGWGLFRPKTTARLAERGYFERAQHRSYGQQWRITDAGRAALRSTTGEKPRYRETIFHNPPETGFDGQKGYDDE